MYNGIINVYKEEGYTSHDVVAKLRGILKQKKIGHTGTLDPQAQGVLPVCLGNATRLCDMMTEKTKTYEAVMLLGIATDTLDTSGNIIRTCERVLGREDIIAAIESFKGEYDQIPPMYSAKKVGGRKLYELAREGIEIKREPVRVRIENIIIYDISDDNRTVRFEVTCSKGTYIRSLCDDIGKKLDHAACMSQLKRTRSGVFDISTAITLKEIEELVNKGRIEEYIINTKDALGEYPKAYVNEEGEKKLKNGNIIPDDCFKTRPGCSDGQLLRVCDIDGVFKALYIFNASENVYKVYKMFP